MKKKLYDQYINFSIVMMTLIILFIAIEVTLRFFRPQYTYSKLLSLTGEQYSSCEYMPFTLKRGYKALFPSQEYPGKYALVSTNSLGLRGAEVLYEKPKDTKRILILGDSYTFGVYVNDNEAYPSVLEQLFLQEGRKVQVINAGYADGWGPEEYYAWLLNDGLKFKPDLVIYGFFIGNDISDILGPKNWVKVDSKGLPLKIVNPDLYIDPLGRIRSKKQDEKTVGAGLIYRIPVLRESHSIILLSRISGKIRNIWLSIKNKGWSDEPFSFILQPNSDDKMLKQEQIFFRLVKGLAEVSRNNGAEFMVLMIPVNFQVEPKLLPVVLGTGRFTIKRNFFQEAKPRFDAMGIKYLDLLEEMKKNPGSYFPANGEVHFNPNGHLFSAHRLKQFLDREGI